ncbi:hypothetical protein DITRI_Ditri04bG0088400 [Diplodiscus trichospermus]
MKEQDGVDHCCCITILVYEPLMECFLMVHLACERPFWLNFMPVMLLDKLQLLWLNAFRE